MTIILVIIGAIIGALSWHVDGLFVGAIFGFLLGAVFKQGKQLQLLQNDVNILLSRHTAQKSAILPTDQTAPIPPAPTSTSENTGTELPVSPATMAQPTRAEAHITPSPQWNEPESLDHPLPAPDAEPALLRYVRNYFSGDHIVSRVGVIVLFFGVAFLLKYAAERSHITIEFKLAGVGIGAIIMLIIGWRLRTRHEDYALVMQGGSIGVLYMTVFASLRLFEVLPPALTLLILISVGVFSAILAVAQNARSLAILGICGGFLAPILTSTGEGNHVVLFSYYALLNAGIFGMSWYKAWRPLNLLGFIFTFVISTYWGVTRYSAADFASTEPFLILFFLFYVGIAVLYANRQAPVLKNYVDGTLVFGTPIIAFGLQAGMMQQYEMLRIFEYGLAVSAVALSMFYLILAKVLFDRQRDTLRLMVESFLALGVVFATLAIPLALDGRWTSASWALEGAAVLWMGVRQRRILPRLFGTLLQFAAGFALLADFHYHASSLMILNSIYIGGMLISFAGLFCAWYLQRNSAAIHELEHTIATVLFTWGVLWWFGAGLHEIEHFGNLDYIYNILLIYLSLSCLAFSWLGTRINWPVARIPALALLPAMVLIALVQWLDVSHPFKNFAYLGWPLGFALLYWVLRRDEENYAKNGQLSATQRNWHMGTLWLLTFIVSWEAAWGINKLVQGQGTWPLIAWALMPGLLLGGLSLQGHRVQWPIAAHQKFYLGTAAMPLAVYLWLWSLLSNISSDGNPYPINYLPLINPLDLAQILVFLVLATWMLKIKQLALPVFDHASREARYTVIATTLFLWLNATLLRTLHYWADVPFNINGMMHSVLVQASISIFWSVLALTIMRYAANKQLRNLWIIGSVLMAAVVLKLFTIDISGIGSLARIISFIGVALLMLLMGYIAPLPAKKSEETHHA